MLESNDHRPRRRNAAYDCRIARPQPLLLLTAACSLVSIGLALLLWSVMVDPALLLQIAKHFLQN